MGRKNNPKVDPLIGKHEEILAVLENLFILEGLRAGINGTDIRKILRIKNSRVSRISKTLPKGTTNAND